MLKRLTWRKRWGKKRPRPKVEYEYDQLMGVWRYQFCEGTWFYGYGETKRQARKAARKAMNADRDHFCQDPENCSVVHAYEGTTWPE